MKTVAWPWALILTALCLMPVAGCGDDDSDDSDDTTGPGDTTPPAPVTDLHVVGVAGQVVTLAWTAPGDDGATGTASTYDLRHASAPVTAESWESCTQVPGEPVPAAAGTEQSLAVDTGADGTFHFALRAADEVPNWSDPSNDVAAAVGGSGGFTVHQLTTTGNNVHPCLDEEFVVWIATSTVDGDELYIADLGSASPTPTRLTDNGGRKVRPRNHGAERIVWSGRTDDTDDWEIWVYDRNSVPRFAAYTDNDVPDLYPDLAGAGDFCWLQGRTMLEAVHWWTESLHDDVVISDDCCPTSEWSNDVPSADDGAAVWRSYHRSVGGEHRIYLWDGALTDLTDVLVLAHDFSLQAGTIAYESGSSPAFVHYWDGTQIHEVGQGYKPSLFEGSVAYEFWDGEDWEIRFWDGTTVHDITDNAYDDSGATLYGSRIAWVGRPSGPAGVHQIFWADLDKGVTAAKH